MVARGTVVLWAVFMCLSFSTATWPAFLVQVRTGGQHVGTGTVASHGIQYRAGRKADTPLFSATEKADTTQEVRCRSWSWVGTTRPRPSHEHEHNNMLKQISWSTACTYILVLVPGTRYTRRRKYFVDSASVTISSCTSESLCVM